MQSPIPPKRELNFSRRRDTKIVLQKLSPQENTFLGLTVGFIDTSSTQWMLYCKNASQQRLPMTLNLRVLYRGYFANLANLCIKRSLCMPIAAGITNTITGGSARRLTDGEQFAAAIGAGFVSSFVVSPVELVMIQQQRFGTTLVDTPFALSKAHGPAVFGRAIALQACSGLGPPSGGICRKISAPLAPWREWVERS